MARLAERTLIHYSKNKITDLKNETTGQVKLVGQTGKPIGFWYAYGEDWKQYITNHLTPHSSRTMNNTTFRYEFTLPEDTFVTEIGDASPNTILELSKANLDVFMKRFVKEDYQSTVFDIVEIAIQRALQDGESSILQEIANQDEEKVFTKFYNLLLKTGENNKSNENSNENAWDIDGIIDMLFDRLPSDYVPSRKALKGDGILPFKWDMFWKDVSDTMGGIEFHKDLFDSEQWETIDLPWTRLLDIRSGVIFHPSAFRNGILMEQLELQPMDGGKKRKRRTRRKRGGIRKTKTKRNRGGRRYAVGV